MAIENSIHNPRAYVVIAMIGERFQAVGIRCFALRQKGTSVS